LLASVKALLLLAAVGVPIYIFITSQTRSTHESTPRRPAAVTVPLIDDGFRDPASWVDASGSSTRLRTSMHDDSLVLPAPARSWRAVYLSPERTAGWRDYRVRMRVERLGPAGSGANATLLLGSGGGLAITVSAAVVRVSDRTGTRSRQLALDAFGRPRVTSSRPPCSDGSSASRSTAAAASPGRSSFPPRPFGAEWGSASGASAGAALARASTRCR
jgi:hypothetical protein